MCSWQGRRGDDGIFGGSGLQPHTAAFDAGGKAAADFLRELRHIKASESRPNATSRSGCFSGFGRVGFTLIGAEYYPG
jgi:hypothetical protein